MTELDRSIFRLLYGGDGAGPLAIAMIALTVLGSGWTALALIPLMALPRTRRFAVALALVLAVQGLAVVVLKRLIGRVRPWQALGLHPLHGVPLDFSFPSGHAAGSFTVAAFVTTIAFSKPWRLSARSALALGLVALAAAIALSRVYLGAHYPGDVAAGAILGGLLGWIGARFYTRAARPSPTPTAQV